MKILMVLFFSTGLLASEGGKKAMRKEMKKEVFAEKKKMALNRIEERLKGLSEAKGCISAAQDMKALKNCRQTSKAMRKENKAKFKQLRDAKRAEWKQKREQIKAQKLDVKNVESH